LGIPSVAGSQRRAGAGKAFTGRICENITGRQLAGLGDVFITVVIVSIRRGLRDMFFEFGGCLEPSLMGSEGTLARDRVSVV